MLNINRSMNAWIETVLPVLREELLAKLRERQVEFKDDPDRLLQEAVDLACNYAFIGATSAFRQIAYGMMREMYRELGGIELPAEEPGSQEEPWGRDPRPVIE